MTHSLTGASKAGGVPKGHRWRRFAAGLGLLALCVNLLVPLAVLAATPPAEAGIFICHSASAGPAGDTSAPESAPAGVHHCPLCLVFDDGVAASPVATAALLPPLRPVLTQPHWMAAVPPPGSARLTAQQPRAPPAA